MAKLSIKRKLLICILISEFIIFPSIASAEVFDKNGSSYVIKSLPKPLVCNIKDNDGNVHSEEIYTNGYLNGKLVL